jgi:hypothetical protein
MRKSTFLLLLLALGATKAFSNPITLTTGLETNEAIGTFYDGGVGGYGSVFTGPNCGISLGSNSLAIISELNGGVGWQANRHPAMRRSVCALLTKS